MQASTHEYGIDLPTGSVPLLLARIQSTSKYLLFAYDERSKSPSDSNPTPYLIERELESVPEQLTSFLAPYPVSLNPTSSDLSKYPKHLRYLTVINSTQSGTQKSSTIYFSIILPLLKRFNMSHVYVATSSQTSILNHAGSFTDPSTVVLLTGDTSISEFVNCLQPRTKSPDIPLILIVIPTGTGNALANSSGLNSIQKAVSRMFLGTPKPLASFQVEFPNRSSFIHNEPTTKLSPAQIVAQASSNIVKTPDAPSGSHSSIYNRFFNKKDTDSYFDPPLVIHAIAVLSWAAHASLVADSDSPEFRRLGEARFRKAAEENMARSQKYHGQVVLGEPRNHSNKQENTSSDIELTYINPFNTKSGKNADTQTPLSPVTVPLPHKLASDHGYLLFSLVSNIEKTYAISPDSHSPSDLTLHLVHTDYTTNDRLAQMMMAPYTPRAHLSLGSDVQYFSFSYKNPTVASKYVKYVNNVNESQNKTSPNLSSSSSSGNAYNSNSCRNSNKDGTKAVQPPPLVAEIYPQETDSNYVRWCIDGALLNVPNDMGPVKVRMPTYSVRGWALFLVT